MRYRLSSLAEQDLDEIWSYVADDASPGTADRLVDAIIDRLDLLAEHPGMGRGRPEPHSTGWSVFRFGCALAPCCACSAVTIPQRVFPPVDQAVVTTDRALPHDVV